MSSQIPSDGLYLYQARASTGIGHCMSIYEKWAATYNEELANEAQNYVAPALVAQAALRKLSRDPTKIVILDAGCGTGLVGNALAAAGARVIDGLDLSSAMLAVANQTGTYRNLIQADLTKPVQMTDETYDMVTCVGTFTLGHVGPRPALREYVRVAKKNGIIATTILEEIWVSGGFQEEFMKLVSENLATVVTQELVDYVKGPGHKAVLVILRKTGLI